VPLLSSRRHSTKLCHPRPLPWCNLGRRVCAAADEAAAGAAADGAAAAGAPLPDLSQVLDPTAIVKAATLAEPAAIAEAAADVYAPTQGIQQLLVAIHSASGLDWWASIMLTTFGVRLLTFPVMLYQIKNTYKMSQARPELEKLVEWMKQEQARGNAAAVVSTVPAKLEHLSGGQKGWCYPRQCGSSVAQGAGLLGPVCHTVLGAF
jgi:hypothetical protein